MAYARRRFLALLTLAPLAPLAGCGDDTQAPPPSYTPLAYTYLRPLRLNVGTIDTQNDYAPGPNDLSPTSPANPAQALLQMAKDRLVPAGAAGRAVFSVRDASITQAAGQLSGRLQVRLDIYTSDGRQAAYAQAAVVRAVTAPDGTDQLPQALYGLTRQMMDDMNVELEFQMRRTLQDWMQTGAATAPPPAAVEQQPLAAPNAAPIAPSSTPGFRFVPSQPPGQP